MRDEQTQRPGPLGIHKEAGWMDYRLQLGGGPLHSYAEPSSKHVC